MTSPAERLKEARERAGFASAKSAAEAMGIAVATYVQHENGSRGFGRNALKYARRFRVTPEWLLYGRGAGDPPPAPDTVLTEVRSAGVSPNKLTGGGRMPLLGTALGAESADLEDDIELTELHLNDVLDYLAKPEALAGDPGAYALTIVGNSMVPRFKPGERVAVSPRAIVGIGDDVIVQLRGGEGEGERIKMVLIKELVRRTASYVELRQFNPDTVFRVEAKRVAAMHKVRGTYF
jgi:phage repressor protein C with HTH and peptisase S24 domain